MGFRIGQEVECVNDDGWAYVEAADIKLCSGPRKGDIVKISGISPPPMPVDGSLDYVMLKLEGYPQNENYYSRCFRPLQETGMSIFKAILANPHKQLETVE